MEHDIGCKIKAARIEKKLTQEQVAELLGVSRQTISNWENEKSYPDIISVIKMSECYDVSLDYLLEGEQKMKSYYDYLEESTNVVKSNANRNKIMQDFCFWIKTICRWLPFTGKSIWSILFRNTIKFTVSRCRKLLLMYAGTPFALIWQNPG